MTTLALSAYRAALGIDRVVVAIVAIVLLIALVSPGQAVQSIAFTGGALVDVSIFLLLSVGVTAYAKASGSDRLIAKAFSGNTGTMIVAASLMGALSPFCSCGVIPLIAALLAMGVPLAAGDGVLVGLADHGSDHVRADRPGRLAWISPSAKTMAAIGHRLDRRLRHRCVRWSDPGRSRDPLQARHWQMAGAGPSSVRSDPTAGRWKLLGRIRHRREAKFSGSALGRDTLGFLGKWLVLAFLLESVMLAYIPADFVKPRLPVTAAS